jgi:hypothetical protein
LLRQPKGPARPEAFGKRFSSGTSAPPSTISPVTEARNDSLPSIFGVSNPFVPRSTIKPRILPPSFAHTTAMSAIGELEILALSRRAPPSSRDRSHDQVREPKAADQFAIRMALGVIGKSLRVGHWEADITEDQYKSLVSLLICATIIVLIALVVYQQGMVKRRTIEVPVQRPQASSASRFTAGSFGFFDLIQCGERPLLGRVCERIEDAGVDNRHGLRGRGITAEPLRSSL